MIDAQYPARPAFDHARDKIAFLESCLTETQRAQYDEFVKRQEREKEEQKQKAERAKAAYDQAKEKHPRAAFNYNPPVQIKDPHLKRLAVIARNEQQKVTALERTQMEDKIQYLEKLDRQREKQAQQKETAQEQRQAQFRDNAQRVTQRRASPEFARAASPERPPQTQHHESALSRAFEKARAQEQARERAQTHTQSREHGQSRERGRN